MTTPDGEISVEDQLIGIIKNMSQEKQVKLLDLLGLWNEQGERESNRKGCLIAVDYSTDDRFYRDFIQNISSGGVFIETRELFTSGQNIGLTFSIPNSQIPFRVTGEITRISNRGIAVKFLKVTSYQQEILETLVEKM